MKFRSLRTSLVGSLFALVAALMLGSCGGGGAASDNQGGPLVILPATGTFFAGMPATFTVGGGRRPYRIVSSQPGILSVPYEINATSFTVIPSNPGVVDTGIDLGELPVRTVIISVTDAENQVGAASIQVAQNFLTGYGISFTSNCPSSGTTGAGPQACAGGETLLRIEGNFNGALIGGRTYRLEALRGPFYWVYPDGQIAGNTITVTTDHEGKAFVILRVNNNVPTQIATFRIVDVATGVSTEHAFIITGTPLAAELAIIPSEFTFTGSDTSRCGTGSAQFLVFDGLPPYTATSTSGQVVVTPTTTDAQPGQFTFTVSDSSTCLTNATIVVTDSRNARGIVTITTEAGTNDPPPPPMRAVPASVTLTCPAPSASTLIVGGTDPAAAVAASSTDSRLSFSYVGRAITITFNPVSGGVTTPVPPTVSSTVVVTDGASTVTVGVRRPSDCT